MAGSSESGMAVVIGSRQGPGRALKTTQGAEVKGNPEISPHSPAYAPAGAVPAIMRKTRVVPLTSRRPSRRPSRPLRRLVVARRRSRLVSAAAAADPALPVMGRCRTRILGPAATIRRRSKHAIHGATSVVMSADGLIATPMFINSSGSPGSWPSWATDARYLLLNLRRHQETSNTFPESGNVLTWRTGPS